MKKQLKYCRRGAGFIDDHKFDRGEDVCRNCKTYPSGTASRCDKQYKERKQ